MVLAACALHNFLREKVESMYIESVVDKEAGENHDVVPGSWRAGPGFNETLIQPPKNPTKRAKELRDYVCSYVNSDAGSVPWQWSKI